MVTSIVERQPACVVALTSFHNLKSSHWLSTGVVNTIMD
jgi:hypothetical protein